MKNFPPILSLFISTLLFAQWDTSTIFSVGTKIDFYHSACNSSVPNTENKFTFCDNNENLGVISESYGLISNNILKIVPNYFNNDEVFITYDGFSIHKEDGNWRNLPREFLPRATPTSPASNPTEAVVHTDGKLYYRHGSDFGLHWVDITTMDKGKDEFSNYCNFFTVSPSTQTLYSFYVNSATTNFVVKNSNSVVSTYSVQALNNIYIQKMLYSGGCIYYIALSGVYKQDVNSPQSVIHYDATDLGYSFTALKDGCLDSDGNLWLTAVSGTNYAVVKFNPSTLSSNVYQTNSPQGNQLAVNELTVDDTGKVWIVSNNFQGVTQLTFDSSNQPVWSFITLDMMETYIDGTLIYNFNSVDTFNGKVFLCGRSNSSSPNDGVEIVYYEEEEIEEDSWKSISDDNPGNIPHAFAFRQNNSYATPNGVWWGNSYDNSIGFIGNNNYFLHLSDITHSSNSGIVADTDGNPLVIQNSLKKIFPPIEHELPLVNNESYTVHKKYRDQIWAYSHSNDMMTVYKNNNLSASYDLNLPFNAYHFDIDSDKNAWFAHYNNSGGMLTVYKFIVDSSTINEFDFETPFVGSLQKIIAANGYMVLLFTSTVICYDGNQFYRIDNSNNSNLTNLADAVADQDGGIHVLRSAPAKIISIDSPLSDNPNFEVMSIDGVNSILPYVEMYQPRTLALDYEGHFWTQASLNWMKTHLEDAPLPYLPEGNTGGIEGLVYLDNNENDLYDDGEGFPNQKVTLKQGDYELSTFTDANGKFFFIPNELGQNHKVTLTSFQPNIRPTRVQAEIMVNDFESSYDLGEFQMEMVNVEGLVVKTSTKEGAWGFIREGFENTFTTAIGSVSNQRVYNNLELEYLFKNKDENSTNILPDVEEVKIYKLTPNNLFPIIFNVKIEPRRNDWKVNISPDIYMVEEIFITPDIVQNEGELKVNLTIPQISPYETYIIQYKTGLFDAAATGTPIVYGPSKIGGNDAGGSQANPEPIIINLIPRDDDPNLGSPAEFNPYIHPDDVIDEIPFDEPMDFYVPFHDITNILSSYDPNEKLVSPGLPEELNEHNIEDKWLQYTICFENMGNFSAKDIVIIDTLDANLDTYSLILGDASHPVKMSQFEMEGKTVLKFAFEDIFLDYTAHNPLESQGYVKYWIKANEDIALNTIVKNSASIYFDQNPPILTNTTHNKFIEIELSVEDFDEVQADAVQVFPNPIQSQMNIKFPKKDDYRIQLFDTMGKQLFQIHIDDTTDWKTDLSHYHSGIYILNIIDSKGRTSSFKVIKH